MAECLTFREVLDAADQLTRDEQQEIVAILRRRMAEAGRQRIIEDIRDSRREFAAVHCRPATPEEIFREIAQLDF